MKNPKIILTILLTIAAVGSSSLVRAESAKEEDAPVHGTIPVAKKTSKVAYASMAKVQIKDAITTGLAKLPGVVTQAELAEDDGFLLWEVHIVSAKGEAHEVVIDAGNGKVLAVEADDEGSAADKD